MCFISCHNHDSTSNFKLLDCITSVEELILTASELSYKGLAITNHETISSHVEAIKVTRKLKKERKISDDFMLILGNEIYLLDDVEYTKQNYKSGETKFPHFLLLAKSKQGHEALRRLSSMAWGKNYFRTGFMERTPTDKKDLEQIAKEYPNQLIATTACLGSESSIHLLEIKDAEKNDDKEKAEYHRQKLNDFILWCIDVFGKENFFIELQPALSEEQQYVNSKLIPLADYYGLKRIITTDTHYLRPEHRNIHKAFLNAKEGEREVDSFYADTYLHTIEEIAEKMKDYINLEVIQDAINNTLRIGEMVEDYTIEQDTVIPKIDLPEFEVRHIFKPAYDQYEYISKMANSLSEQDRYLIKLIEDGFYENIPRNVLTKEKFHQILARINVELGELWEISQEINQATSSYYITVAKIVDLIWSDDCGNSIVGSGRGSAGGFLICFLLGITQINPLEYGIELPHWRHIHRSRPDIGALDIDLDTEGSKREQIIQGLKNYFGEERLLQVCTHGRIGSKSALQIASRGLGIDSDTSQYLSSLVPWERGQNWSLSDCIFGNEEKQRKPVKELINELEKYEGLKETALMVEGKVDKRSIHAGGVILFNEEFYKSNALMRAPNGVPVTQFNLDDSQAVGNMKFDLLVIEAADKIRTTLDLLLEHQEIEWQSSLRKTFNKYLHPEVIDRENPKIYQMLGEGSVSDLFQFSTDIGHSSAIKVKPRNLIEVASANSLMRLMSDDKEQPIDTFVRYKNNIQLWFNDMKEYGLTDTEIDVMKKHLLKFNGVADTQESIMLLSMDNRISGFDVKWANKLRKAVAKPNSVNAELAEVRTEFYKRGLELNNSKTILDYVWNVQIKRQLKYSFSIIHTLCYSVIALQELNLNYYYNPLYWQTACLISNSGGISMEDELEHEDENLKKKQSKHDYGKVATAIGNIQKHGIKVDLPDINRAGYSFVPDIKNNTIVFGLNGISGIGEDVIKEIISHRPYNSFMDFYNRMVETKIVKNSQMIQLIKAGCFDTLSPDRIETMKQYLKLTSEPKTKLTLANLKSIIDYNLIPDAYALKVRFFRFRDYISKKVYKTIAKPKDRLFILDDISTQFFTQHFKEDAIVEVADGQLVISEKIFKKEYDKKMEVIKEWLQSEELLIDYNNKLLQEAWEKHASGSISSWEMDSVSYYSNPHELINVNNEKYNIVNFFELAEDPEPIDYYEWRGRQIPEYELYRIAGTVLDKDKTRHTVSLLTIYGVVTVKLQSGRFSFYDRQLSEVEDGKKQTIEKSWFTRGNLMMVTGFRRGNQFVAKKYRDSIYQHSVVMIEGIENNGDLILKLERERVG